MEFRKKIDLLTKSTKSGGWLAYCWISTIRNFEELTVIVHL